MYRYGANLYIFIARFEIHRGDHHHRRDGGVAHEVLHVYAQSRAGVIRDDDLRVADRQHIVLAQLARTRKRPAIQAQRTAAFGRDDEPVVFATLERECGAWRHAGHDDIGAFAADGNGCPQRALTRRLSDPDLRVRARFAQRGIIHGVLGPWTGQIGSTQLTLMV